MAIELKVPSLGESISQATVGAWLKREGDPVQVDEPVVEVESEKATMAVPAPASGILRRILKPAGATVAVGEVIGELEKGEGKLVAVPSPPQAERREAPDSIARPSSMAQAVGSVPPPRAAALPHLTPSARRRLAEDGPPRQEAARALEERPVLAADLQAPSPLEPLGPRERLVPMSPLRRTAARRLLEAQNSAAILTTFNEVDLSQVMALREKHGPAFQEKHGVKLGLMSFFVKAAIEALQAYPAVNAEVRGTDILYKDHYDIGVAVGGGKGLVVPVVRDADRLSFAELELRIAELAKKARENRITMDDLDGGTFTISNGGVYGSLLSTPILNTPQSGILGLHKIQKRPVVGEGDQLVVRPMMYVALSYDHRIIDGREAVGFLVRAKECVEDPERILLEV
jgi:2-oxoglutarate dehydrogenase E2 component (dihydrolipoamide succinyltransferase)